MPIIGSGTNQIQTFADGDGANVETPDAWTADEVRQQGFQDGIANSTQANTVLRQAAFAATMIGQFTSDFSLLETLDNGVVLDFEANFIKALKTIFAPFGIYFIADVGSANQMIGTSDPAPEAYTTPSFIIIKKMNLDNTGPMTVNFWSLGVKTLKDNTGADLAAGALKANAFYMLSYDGGGFRVLGGTSTYTSVTNLTANSGDMIAVETSGIVNFRTLRGNHNINVLDGDKWPRGSQTDDTGQYMLTSEFLAWLGPALHVPKFTISPTAPLNPSHGDHWAVTNTGATYIYSGDGTTSAWIQV